jgi:hypothetical protein
MSRLAVEIFGKPECPKASHYLWTSIFKPRLEFSGTLLAFGEVCCMLRRQAWPRALNQLI